MVRQLLLVAALVAAATAQVEWEMKLKGCGCTQDGVMTYTTNTTAYCPTSTYRSCDVTVMVENNCEISCPGARSVLVYQNNSAVFYPTTSMSCNKSGDGLLRNGAGQNLFNVRRPTCAFKIPCNTCSATSFEATTCPTGYTCKQSNLLIGPADDGCSRVSCAEGTLKFYDASTHVALAYTSRDLYCTVASTWTNYSLDGSTTGGAILSTPFTANCILPKLCDSCALPTIATDLRDLPAPFLIGYSLIAPVIHQEALSCSTVKCPAGYNLYGFNSTSNTATGLEYTYKNSLLCDQYGKFTNGGLAQLPANTIVACLSVLTTTTSTTTTTTTTTAPTTTTTTASTTTTTTAATTTSTTPSPCGAWDAFPAPVGGGSVHCSADQPVVDCGAKKIVVQTAATSFTFEKMSFIAGKGWLSFDCDGGAKMWKTGVTEIVNVSCSV